MTMQPRHCCMWTNCARMKWIIMHRSPNKPFCLQENQLQSYNAFNMTFCYSDPDIYYEIFDLLVFFYLAILVLTSFILILINRRIYSRFRDDKVHSFRALVLSFLPLLMLFIGEITVIASFYQVYWWLSVTALVLFNIIAQMATFLPMVRCQWRVQSSIREYGILWLIYMSWCSQRSCNPVWTASSGAIVH